MLIANFLIGIMIMAAGIVGLKMNYQLVNSFGRNNIFERKLGAGMTYPVFQFLAVLVIIAGFLTMFSLHDNVLRILLSPLINVFQSSQ
jgi:uncharacterized membrane protein SpoIIM required for sporulation